MDPIAVSTMEKRPSFLWGAFGAVLPEVIRIHQLVAESKPLGISGWLTYLISWALFVFCAGMFTVAWKPESEFKAIWVGASWPLLVAKLVQAAPALRLGG